MCASDSPGSAARFRSWRRSRSSLREERNPSIADKYVAEATLRLKGVTLRAEEASPEMAPHDPRVAEDIRRQVKRHRELRRKRTTTRAARWRACAAGEA